MKMQITSRLLCLCLLLCLLCGTAYAAPGETVLYPQRSYNEEPAEDEEEESYYVSSVAIQPEGVYVLVNDVLMTRWQPGDEVPETLFELEPATGYYAAFPAEGEEPLAPEELAKVEASIHTLIAGDDGLYAMNLVTLKLAKVSDTGYEFLEVDLDLPEMKMQESDWNAIREIYNAFVYQGNLFLLLGSEQQNDWESRYLFRAPLSGEPHQAYEVPTLATVTPYKDGKLLATLQSTNDRSYGLDLMELDIESGTTGKVLKPGVLSRWYDPSGFAYAPEEEAVYFLENNQVQRLDLATGEITGLTFLATGGYGGSNSRVGLLEGGFFALSEYAGIYIRNIDPAYKVERALRIAGGWENESYRKFVKEHPEIPVLLLDTDYMQADDIAQAIQTGETEVDIYTVYSFGDLSTLLNKGYAADLSTSEVLTSDVAGMYPQVVEALCDGQGTLRAYPMSFNYFPMLVNTTLFEECFPGEELPETWEEFLRLYIEFAEDPPDDVAFLDFYVERDALIYNLLRQFARDYEQDGQEADFEHPALRTALELVAQLPVSEQMDRWADLTGEQIAQLNDYYTRQNIFSTEVQAFEDLDKKAETSYTVEVSPSGGMIYYESYDPEAASASETGTVYQLMAPPVFETGQEPTVQANFACMLVNPESSNLDFAIQYLEALTTSLENRNRYALHPDLNEPARYSYYTSNQRSQQKYIDELEESLEGMEPADRKAAEEQVADMKRRMQEDEENDWEISARAIADYRELAPYISLAPDGIFDMAGQEGSTQIYDLIDRYVQGQLQLDPFLKELNGKARMIRREQM